MLDWCNFLALGDLLFSGCDILTFSRSGLENMANTAILLNAIVT